MGLVPAGGKGKRISPLPCSKELYPVGFHDAHEDLGLRPKVVSHYLLEKMRLANITKTYIILRKGKWDIPAYFGDGKIREDELGISDDGFAFWCPLHFGSGFSLCTG